MKKQPIVFAAGPPAGYTVTATSGEEVGHTQVDVPGLPDWEDVPLKWATWADVDVPTWEEMTSFTPVGSG